MMQGGCGKHNAQLGIARRDPFGEPFGPLIFKNQHDGGGGGKQKSLLLPVDAAGFFDLFDRREHHREGFGFPALAGAEETHRFRAAGVAEKLETSQAFQGHDLALADGIFRQFQGLVFFGQ